MNFHSSGMTSRSCSASVSPWLSKIIELKEHVLAPSPITEYIISNCTKKGNLYANRKNSILKDPSGFGPLRPEHIWDKTLPAPQCFWTKWAQPPPETLQNLDESFFQKSGVTHYHFYARTREDCSNVFSSYQIKTPLFIKPYRIYRVLFSQT